MDEQQEPATGENNQVDEVNQDQDPKEEKAAGVKAKVNKRKRDE